MSVVDSIIDTEFFGIPAWPIVLVGAAGVAYMLSSRKSSNAIQPIAVPYAEPTLVSAPGPAQNTNVLIRFSNIFAPVMPSQPKTIAPLPTGGALPESPQPANPTPVAPTPAPAPGPVAHPGTPTPVDPCANMTYETALNTLVLHPDETYLNITMLWAFNRNLVSETDEHMARDGDAQSRMKLAKAWAQIHNITDLGHYVCSKGWVK